MKKIFLCLSLFMFIFVGCISPLIEEVKVTGVKLDTSGLGIDEGEKSIALKVTIEPADATNKNVTWSSMDETIATVENGVITGVSVGETDIVVTTEDGNKTAKCHVTVREMTIKPENDKPYVIENEDGSSFTITPADLGSANYWISKDKKTVYLGGKNIVSDDAAVATGYGPETYTLTGNFKGHIVVSWDEVEIELSGANIENTNAPAISGDFKTFITAKKDTTNYVKSSGKDEKNDKSAAILIDNSVDFGGKGTLYVEGSIYHGVKAKKVELKGSGNYYFKGTEKGSAINCNSLNVKEDKTFTAYFSDAKNGIKADDTIGILSGTFNFENLKTALKTDTKADDKKGSEKDHYIKLQGGVFNCAASVENFASTEENMLTTEGATVNK